MTSQKEVFLYDDHPSLIQELAFAGRPLADLIYEIQELYTSDSRPWIIGFSGGKDSTTVVSLVVSALQQLPIESLKKPVFIVSSDTLVETPLVIDVIKEALESINKWAKDSDTPMSAHSVFPNTEQTFWVNLLGRGYPAPSSKFRWCTERMKIDPVSEFIVNTVSEYGEVIVLLGSRSQESSSRAQVIAKHRIEGTSLGRHSSLPNAYTYMPIVDWNADEVWEYLMSAPRPWSGTNRALFDLYKGSNQGECPLVIDKSTPSCGNSRFGCWTCTVVTEDKALHGLIEAGDDWMLPLLEFRNQLYQSAQPENSTEFRNSKRRTGIVSFDKKSDGMEERKHIRGPYWMAKRHLFVRDLLEVEKEIRLTKPDMELIKREELQLIRQHWLTDPNEPDWKDSLPQIYAEVYPDDEINWIESDAGAFSAVDEEILREIGLSHGIPPELPMKLLEAELDQIGETRRRGLLKKLDSILSKDWEDFETIRTRHEYERSSSYDSKIESLRAAYDEVAELDV
jgi:DNA sulfur modification protein DndC